jgi:rhodanese-related sulfurtransferase
MADQPHLFKIIMKTRIGFLLLFLLVQTGTLAQSTKKDSVEVLSTRQFERKSNKKNTLVIDVRTPEEVAEGHLPESLNIDYTSQNFAEEIVVLNKKATYLVYCRTGKKSRGTADLMQKMGFKHVYMLDGGFTAWQDAGKQIEK